MAKENTETTNKDKLFGAVLFGKQEEMPKHARPLHKPEIINIYNKFIYAWNPWYEMIPLRYGCGIFGVGTIAFAHFYQNRLRRLLFLENNYRKSGLIIGGFFPAYVTYALHSEMVQRPIKLNPFGCDLCYSMKAGVYNVLLGVVLPTVLSTWFCTVVGAITGFYNFGEISRKDKSGYFKNLGRACVENVRGQKYVLVSSMLILFVLGHALTFLEVKNAQRIASHLAKGLPPGRQEMQDNGNE